MLKIIRKRGTSAFDKFVDVLLESETQHSLGNQLREGVIKWKMDDEKYGKFMQIWVSYSVTLDPVLFNYYT